MLGITIVWFLIHPSLRYGGYHLFFLIFFIPLCIFLENYNLDSKEFLLRTKLLLALTLIIFLSRNIDRLIDEYKVYSYNPFKSTNFLINEETFKINKRYKKIRENKILCDENSEKCDDKLYKLKKIYQNRYIIYRN